MSLNASEIVVTPRLDTESYNLQITQSTLDILCLILEFKFATAWQITRFLTQKDRSKYIYRKLHRMWQAGLLDTFKTSATAQAGIPVYYMLSKQGLEILKRQGKYDPTFIKNYPHAKTLHSSGLLNHEAQVIELASMEAKNKNKNLNITFKGEVLSTAYDLRSDKNIEAFTPDYTVFYTVGTTVRCIYSECERTQKSKEGMLQKIERYARYLSLEDRKHSLVRLIFQNSHMEQAFWLNILTSKPHFLQVVKIMTTHISYLQTYTQFIEPIYVSENTIKLLRDGRLSVETTDRVKLFAFL